MESGGQLTVALDGKHQSLSWARDHLVRAWTERTGGQTNRAPSSLRDNGPTVFLSRGSVLSGAIIVQYDRPFRTQSARDAASRGLTALAWDRPETGPEIWHELARPLGRLPRWGHPDPNRPWVVTLSHHATDRAIENYCPDAQLHVLGPPPQPTLGRWNRNGVVWWPNTPTVAAAVLGRAALVLGQADALTFDAQRLEIPIETPPRHPPTLLAGLIPATLLTDTVLWSHVADTIFRLTQQGGLPDPLLTPDWIARGRQLAAIQRRGALSGLQRSRRLVAKWQRDPERFCADSHYAIVRRLGSYLVSRSLR